MSEQPCGCCQGAVVLTPAEVYNRPGLDALRYRAGVHATFLETMKARLWRLYLEAPAGTSGEIAGGYPLRALATREPDDPAIALLDAWATVADVLTFYQERIANEGYLRTATERRSVLELARLVGYRLRPGVAASAFLAFLLDKDCAVEIPRGTRTQSIPGPGELPQSFETSEPLPARVEWNEIKPRLTLPPDFTTSGKIDAVDVIYLAGINMLLKPNDPLLFVFSTGTDAQAWRRVADVETQPALDRTKVTWQRPAKESRQMEDPGAELRSRAASVRGVTVTAEPPAQFAFVQSDLIKNLTRELTPQPWSQRYLAPDLRAVWATTSANVSGVMAAVTGRLKKEELYQAMAMKSVKTGPLESMQITRVRAAPFGHNAPLQPILKENGAVDHYDEWVLEKRDVTFTFRMTSESSENIIPDTFIDGHGPFFIRPPINFEVEIRAGESDVCKVSSLDWELVGDPDERTIKTRTRCAGVWVDIEVVCTKAAGGAQGWTKSTVVYNIQQTTQHTVKVAPTDDKGFYVTVERPFSVEFQFHVTQQTPHESEQCRGAISRDGTLEISLTQPSLWTEYQTRILTLDAAYDQIKPESWVIIVAPDGTDQIRQVEKVRWVSVARYGITGRVTQLVLYPHGDGAGWLDSTDTKLTALRSATIYAQSEPVKWVDAPLITVVEGNQIELDGLYGGLREGQWIIISGELADVKGVIKSELAMVAALREDLHYVDSKPLPGDTYHTTLVLAAKLAYRYDRNTVTIYGNVVKATHGETRKEVLGSGDGRQGHQRFTLKQKPLTYLAAASVTGAASTLEVRVNDVLWHEAEDLTDVGPNDRVYVTRADDEENTTVVFGDGLAGARLPSGVENIRATYRNGIGRPGNVAAQQISLLATRPLGVKGVINPLDATGGADRDTRDQARRNAPLGVTALDRLVSVRDYADFALTYAGIGKASAMRLSDGRHQVIHLTIAGLDDIPIDKSSDLHRGLTQALDRLGDPQQRVIVEMRDQILLVIKARVRLLSDYEWETTEPRIRAAMLTAFGFNGRDLGQPVYCSEIIRVIESVPGVAFVDVDLLASISGADIATAANLEAKLKELAQSTTGANPVPPEQPIAAHLAGRDSTGEIHAAQLAFLSPALPQTLMLEVIA